MVQRCGHAGEVARHHAPGIDLVGDRVRALVALEQTGLHRPALRAAQPPVGSLPVEVEGGFVDRDPRDPAPGVPLQHPLGVRQPGIDDPVPVPAPALEHPPRVDPVVDRDHRPQPVAVELVHDRVVERPALLGEDTGRRFGAGPLEREPEGVDAQGGGERDVLRVPSREVGPRPERLPDHRRAAALVAGPVAVRGASLCLVPRQGHAPAEVLGQGRGRSGRRHPPPGRLRHPGGAEQTCGDRDEGQGVLDHAGHPRSPGTPVGGWTTYRWHVRLPRRPGPTRRPLRDRPPGSRSCRAPPPSTPPTVLLRGGS